MDDFNVLVEKIMKGKKSLSYSALSAFLQSPRNFKKYKTDQETTQAMLEGVRFHMACLQPNKFKGEYWVLDDTERIAEIGGKSPRGTKAYKEWKIEEVAKHEGEMIGIDEYNMYLEMSEAIRTNSATSELMSGLTSTEHTFLLDWDGFTISGSVDGVSDSYLIDLKKVANASFEKIKWDIMRKNYHMQAGIYTKAMNVSNYFLIYIDANCEITVVKLTEDTILKGFEKFEFALAKFHECAESDLWDSSYEFFNNGYILY